MMSMKGMTSAESDDGNVTAPFGRHAEQTQNRTRDQSLSL
jgi:hypothetical protein